MLKYSSVKLSISCSDGLPEAITHHLGVEPTSVDEHEFNSGKPGEPIEKIKSWYWNFESPKDADYNPCARVEALLDAIAPFADRLKNLAPSNGRGINCLFHCTHPAGETINGLFDLLILKPDQLKRMGELNLTFGYEIMHFEEKWYEEHMAKKVKKTDSFLHRILKAPSVFKKRCAVR